MSRELGTKETGIGLAPVGRETVQDRVYAELRRALIGGRFAPAQVLTIRTLADALMTSTMPVREAIGRLITEQALEVMPNRSIRVPPVSLARLDDLLRARILIEGEAIALAATRMSPHLLTVIHEVMSEWEAPRPADAAAAVDREVALNQDFHFAIYRACGSAILMPMIESLWLQSGPCTRAAVFAYTEAGESNSARFHHAMLAALEAGDTRSARAALVADISRPFAFLRNKIQAEEVAA